MTPLVIGVTSHRDLPPGDTEAIRVRVRTFLEQLRQSFPGLPLVVLSALAEGGDRLVAEEGLRLGARLIAPLPLPHALYVEDFADTASRRDFEALCAQAETIVLPTRQGHTHHEISNPGDARDRQYAQAGVYIASHCHILLAIWDGQPSDRLGGTAQIVRYHLTGTLPGPPGQERDPRHILGAGDERLLFHIRCGRAGVADGRRPAVTAHWCHAAADAPEPAMPTAFHLMFEHMAAFNADCTLHAAAIGTRAAPVEAATDAAADMGIDRTFREADWLAVHYQRRVLLAMRTI